MGTELARWGVDWRLLVFIALATALSGSFGGLAFALLAVVVSGDVQAGFLAASLGVTLGVGIGVWSWPRTVPFGIMAWAVAFRLCPERFGVLVRRRVAGLAAGIVGWVAGIAWPLMALHGWQWPMDPGAGFLKAFTLPCIVLGSLVAVRLAYGRSSSRGAPA